MTGHGDQDRIWRHAQNTDDAHLAMAAPRLERLVREISRRAAKRSVSNEPLRVANIGVGSGHFERTAITQGWTVHSIDPDGEALARLEPLGIRTHVGRIEALPLEEASFDVVVASEVIEHLTEPQRAAGLAEIHRVLVPGGLFVGTVPDRENLKLGECICPHCGDVFHRFGHHASFDAASLRSELERASFTLDVLKRTAFATFRGRSFRSKLKSLARLALAKLGEPIASPNLMWIAQKPTA